MKQQIIENSHPQMIPFSILVTGATGFIGSKLISKLTSSGYSVKGMSR